MINDKIIESLSKKLNKDDILGREEAFNTAVVIPLISINGELSLLFEKRAKNIRQGSEICFPGGMFDKEVDNNYLDTAIRETNEELGIESEKIRNLGKLGSFVNVNNVIVESFVAELKIDLLDEIKTDPKEVDRIFTVPISYFRQNKPDEYKVKIEASPYEINENGEKIILFPSEELNLPRKYHKPWGQRMRKIYVYKYDGEVIWGITAFLTREFIKRMD